MAVSPLTYATLSLTQGGNDTFIQGTITTGLANQNAGWQIREILIEWGATLAVGIGAGLGAPADCTLGVGFSVKSLTAMPLATDKSTLFVAKRTIKLATAVGFNYADKVWRYAFLESDQVIWPVDPIYVQNHSAATGNAMLAQIRIGYQQVKLTDAQKAALLINALQA